MKELVYTSKYQNLHMDRVNPVSMFTVNLSVTSNLTSSATPRLIYQYKHGYNYVPQFWGLWDIHYSSDLGGYRRGYGYISHNTGFGLTASFYYTIDDTYVRLYFLFDTVMSPPPLTSGTTAVFTGYLFANDCSAQDYTK